MFNSTLTLQKLNCKAGGNAPRALLIVKNKEAVQELYQQFAGFTKFTDLRVYVGYEQLHIDIQKSEIFEGVDILISTPKTFSKLVLLNGVSVAELRILSIDDADFINQNSLYTAILSSTQSIKKCQYVIYSEKMNSRLTGFESYFMDYSTTIAIE